MSKAGLLAEKGDIVELLLNPHAVQTLDGAVQCFMYDEEANVPGFRKYVGYVVDNRDDYLALSQGMDEETGKVPDDIGAIRFYLDAITSVGYVKRKR